MEYLRSISRRRNLNWNSFTFQATEESTAPNVFSKFGRLSGPWKEQKETENQLSQASMNLKTELARVAT